MANHNEEEIKKSVELIKKNFKILEKPLSLDRDGQKMVISFFNGCFNEDKREFCFNCEFRNDEDKCSNFREENSLEQISYK